MKCLPKNESYERDKNSKAKVIWLTYFYVFMYINIPFFFRKILLRMQSILDARDLFHPIYQFRWSISIKQQGKCSD